MRYFRYFLFFILAGCRFHTVAQPETYEQHNARMSWWREARFGMFIHWGLYAIPAGEWKGKTGYGEWVRHSAEIPLNVYDQFQGKFNPVRFNADAWARTAREAGMKYLVITSKHHDGFCMFDTRQTGFSIMNTPFGRDVMKELSAACRKQGIRLCFYYSIMDWHHPDYLPRRDWEAMDRPADSASFDRYVAYMKAQLKELITQYGDIGVLWFDGEWENNWNETWGKELYTCVRGLRPDILVNNRVGTGRLDMEGLTREGAFGGDFGTPEQQIPATGIPGTDWETCMTMNDHWGYNKADKNYKPARELIRMLADIASKGGNFLLNVGPTAEGTMPTESLDRLKEIGKWMKVNGEAIYGTQASPFTDTPWGRCTMKKENDSVILYLHIFHWPTDGRLVVSGLLNDARTAALLPQPGRSLPVSRFDDALLIGVPYLPPDSNNTVIKLVLTGPLDLTNPPVIRADFDQFVDKLRIEIVSIQPGVEIRFTGDGTDPVDTSFLYTEPLEIRGTVTCKARCFRGGKAVSGTAARTFTQVIPYVARAVENPAAGIHYRYYEGTWDSLPDFDTLKVIREGSLPCFSFSPRASLERFGFSYTGYIRVPERNIYTFYTASDDGSRLYIDGKLVVDNDGLHSLLEKEGTIGLARGLHAIRVVFFEKTGSDELKVSVKSPILPKQPLPAVWLFH